MRPKILIVEDEPAIVDTIQYALETDGFETACLSSGQPVLPWLDRQQCDLIILDIGLPDVSGFDLCRDIRKKHTLPIIFLTARADEIDRVVGLEIGADDYVTKPFSPRELSARVKAILRRTGTKSGSEPSATTFQVDDARHQICYFGTALELSKHEYDLLQIFIRRPGRVFSRQQLMDLAWDAPEASMDRTVDAHIKNVRAKLKAINPEIDAIVTHRGIGYSLKEDL